MINPVPIFIVGAPRSGTSLLRSLLCSHPELFFRSETQFIPAFYRAFGDPQSRDQALRLAKRIVRLEWIARWEEDIDVNEMADQKTFSGLVDNMFMQVARQEEKKIWGDKTPHYILHIATLREIYPYRARRTGYRLIHSKKKLWLQNNFCRGHLLEKVRPGRASS